MSVSSPVLIVLVGSGFHPLLGQSERTPVPHSETGAKSMAAEPPGGGTDLWADWLPTRPSSEMGMSEHVPRQGSLGEDPTVPL